MSSVGGAVGGILGAQASAGASGNANNDANISNQILQQIGAAPDVSAPLILQQYKQAGLLTPEMEANITAQMPQAIGNDSTATNAQTQALQQMQQRAQGGLSAGDRAALTQSNLAAQGAVQGRLGSIAQNMQQQGLSDSGTKLAMQLSAAQGGQNTAASNANQIAQQAQQAAIQASGQAAGLGGQIEQQQFSQGMANQKAATQMQRFNIQNQLGVQQQNTNAANQAQAGNLANAQQLGNANTSAQNAELYNQQQQAMNQYNANKNTSEVQAGGYSGLGAQQQQLANTQAQAAVNEGSGIGGMVGAGMTSGLGGIGGGSSGSDQTANNNQSGGGFSSSDWASYTGGQAPSFKQGGTVPGQAKLPGDHPQNDTVHAMLSPGEIVIPRTLAKSSLGKKLLKLLSDHHEVQNELDKHGQG
jgi:hypothetical protein